MIGGDLNTVPAEDWSATWAAAPNHLGTSYPLTATKVVTDAGFVDTFRAAHPDAGAVEGRTWSPLPTERLITPAAHRHDLRQGPGRRRGRPGRRPADAPPWPRHVLLRPRRRPRRPSSLPLAPLPPILDLTPVTRPGRHPAG
ncbi:hypothetical protein [Nonomuraea dietziae]|uniref:hypothetical protein n=1 Tax=Nonomuraea dietziae TaxID=65515 RepID=UPI0031D7BA01